MKHIWTEERVLQVIEDVSKRGFVVVAEEMGYKTRESLQLALRKKSQEFNLLDLYQTQCLRNGPRKNRVLWTEERVLQVIEDVSKRGFDAVAEDMGYASRDVLETLVRDNAVRFGYTALYNDLIRPRHEWTEEFFSQVLEDVKAKGVKSVAKELGYSDRYTFMDSFRDASVKYGKLPEYEQFLIRKRGKWTEEFVLQVLEDVSKRGFDEVSEELGYASGKAFKDHLKKLCKKFNIALE